MKKILTPLILLAVLLGLAGVSYWDEKKTEIDKTAEEAKGKLFSFKSEDITSIRITNLAATPSVLVVAKDVSSKAWNVVSPINYPADGEGIERLLKIIIDAKAEREFDKGGAALESFGLEPAQIVYDIKDKGGESYRFSLGGKSPTGFSSYALKELGSKVLLVNQYLFTATNKALSDLRDRRLGVPVIGDIESVEVDFTGQAPIRLERIREKWTIAAPFRAEGDTIDTNHWLSSWDNLRVLDFIDSPAPELRKALTVIGKGTREIVRIQFDAGQVRRSYLIVENNGKYFTQLTDRTFVELDKPSIESLRKSPREFENRSVFKFVSADVSRVVIDGKAYIRAKDDWISEKDRKTMPFVQSLIVSLEFAKADSILSAKEAEVSANGPVLHKVSIKEGQKPEIEFDIWKKVDNRESAGMYVLKTGDAYFQVNSEFVDLLKPKSPDAKRASN